jgi:hypothetical protein
LWYECGAVPRSLVKGSVLYVPSSRRYHVRERYSLTQLCQRDISALKSSSFVSSPFSQPFSDCKENKMLFGFPLTALSASTFLTLFTRQLVVPSLSEPAGMNATGVSSIVPVTTIQSDAVTVPPFTSPAWNIGPGPAMSSPTAASSWTNDHGLAVPEPTSPMSLFQVATKAAPHPASTLITVVKQLSAALNTSVVTRRPLVTQKSLRISWAAT